MASTLDKENSFDGFTPFRYVVRKNYGYVEHVELAQDITSAYCCKEVARLEGKFFDEDNHRVYNSFHVAVSNYGLIHCDKHWTKNNGQKLGET